jgi:hypothetical protein
VSALDGFLATWSQARATFGEGVPNEGSQFDHSGRLRGLQDDVKSLAPGSDWTGSGSDTYADANSRQARTLGNLADLDERLGAEVDRSAAVVSAGRRDLDAVRQWVVDAAATVPRTAAGDRMLWSVVSKGSGELTDIINRSNGDLAAIAQRIRGMGSEYQALGSEGKGGKRLDKNAAEPKTPDTTLDLDDITRKPPFVPGDDSTLAPPHSIEIGPGTYVPANDYAGVEPTPPKAPLDYNDIDYRGPYDPGNPDTWGRPGYMELVPNSGAWVPDPNAPGFVPHPPEVPVDMATAKVLQEGELAPAGMIPIYPGARIAIPDPNADAPR